MTRLNPKAKDFRVAETRLAGGMGALAANQDAEGLLRRSVLANMLWENNFYEDGKSNAENIAALIPLVDPAIVAKIVIEARFKQKIRHTPLFMVREMARLPKHKAIVGDLLPAIITRADQITDFLALYWKDGKQPLSAQVKKGLAEAFKRFDEYQLAKYDGDDKIKLRDVLMMVHARPSREGVVTGDTEVKIPALQREHYKRGPVYRDLVGQGEIWTRLVDGKLVVPDTWEVALSSGKDKKETFERLIKEGKLLALAFVRNLRNMEEAGVDPSIIRQGFASLRAEWLVPLDFYKAAKIVPQWRQELEEAMYKCLDQASKLPGRTILVVDVSGSMQAFISEKSKFSRLEAAAAIAMLAVQMCERSVVYVTSGSDWNNVHKTQELDFMRGFSLSEAIVDKAGKLGGGGIFTRQALNYIKGQEREKPDRIIVFSDSQDCDHENPVPHPFAERNYVVDVASHKNGINYKGIWTAEISGWSEYFLEYIAALENLRTSQ